MIGVVGGGLAGLTAAYRLHTQGYDVRVFEASADCGGRARVRETVGDPLEWYPHVFSKTDETVVELLTELGLEDRLESYVETRAYYADGTVHPVNTPWQVLAYPPLSTYDTIRLGLFHRGIDGRGFPRRRPRFAAYDDPDAFEDVSAEVFLSEHTTDHAYEHVWKPLLEAHFGARGPDVTAAWVLEHIRANRTRSMRRGTRVAYLEGGLSVLVDALVEAVGHENVLTETRVTDVRISDGAVDAVKLERARTGSQTALEAPASLESSASAGCERQKPEIADGGSEFEWISLEEGGDGDEREREHETDDGDIAHTDWVDVDALVVATMPTVLEELTGYRCEIDTLGTICSVLSTRRPVTDTYRLIVADDASFGSITEHTNLVPADRYGGEHLVSLCTHVDDLDEEPWSLPDTAIERRWLEELSELFPDFDRGDLNWIVTTRESQAVPVFTPGSLESLVPLDLSDDGAQGLYYAGVATPSRYPDRSVAGALRAGLDCAHHLVHR